MLRAPQIAGLAFVAGTAVVTLNLFLQGHHDAAVSAVAVTAGALAALPLAFVLTK